MSKRKKSFSQRFVEARAWLGGWEQQVIAADFKYKTIVKLLKGGDPEPGASNRFYFKFDNGNVYTVKPGEKILGEYSNNQR